MMSRPDLWRETSARRNSRSRRCRFSIASRTLKRGRTPRKSATSPRHGFKSTIAVGRLVSRASSHRAVHRDGRRAGAALRPETHIRHARLARAGGRGIAAGGGLPHRPLERLLGTARDAAAAPREELVGAGAHRLEKSIQLRRPGDGKDAAATPECAARSRSIVAMPDDASVRMSMMNTSAPPGLRSSMIPTGTPEARSIRAISCLQPSSLLRIETASWAIRNASSYQLPASSYQLRATAPVESILEMRRSGRNRSRSPCADRTPA